MPLIWIFGFWGPASIWRELSEFFGKLQDRLGKETLVIEQMEPANVISVVKTFIVEFSYFDRVKFIPVEVRVKESSWGVIVGSIW